MTDRTLRSLIANTTRRRDIWDTVVSGFRVRLSPGGHCSFVVRYRVSGRLRRFTIRPYSRISLAELCAREREIAALQVQLLSATDRAERQRLLDQIFIAEGRLAPVTSELFRRTRTTPRRPLTLEDVQQALRPDELLLEFTLTEPDSYCIVVTRSSARLQRLPGKATIETQVTSLLTEVREGRTAEDEARAVSTTLLTQIPELSRKQRVIVSPDGELHQVPFELLPGPSGQPLLRSRIDHREKGSGPIEHLHGYAWVTLRTVAATRLRRGDGQLARRTFGAEAGAAAIDNTPARIGTPQDVERSILLRELFDQLSPEERLVCVWKKAGYTSQEPRARSRRRGQRLSTRRLGTSHRAGCPGSSTSMQLDARRRLDVRLLRNWAARGSRRHASTGRRSIPIL